MDAVKGFLYTLLSVGLMLIAYVIIAALLILGLYGLCGKKIYRGIGLHRFATSIAILSPLIFIGAVIFINVTAVPHPFFMSVVLFLEFTIPPILTFCLKKFTRRCKQCGLINTYKTSNIKTENLGKEHKFHTEEGYRHMWKTADSVLIQDVPPTTVYDGLFEKKRITTDYRCTVCENIVVETEETETKVGG